MGYDKFKIILFLKEGYYNDRLNILLIFNFNNSSNSPYKRIKIKSNKRKYEKFGEIIRSFLWDFDLNWIKEISPIKLKWYRRKIILLWNFGSLIKKISRLISVIN